MADVPDRRVARTKDLLLVAVLELMAEQGWERTTVQQIVDRANVGRSTFYSHYETKEGLLGDGIQALITSFVVEDPQSQELPTLRLFEHIESNAHVAIGLRNSKGFQLIMTAIRRALMAEAVQIVRAAGADVSDSVDVEFKSDFHVRSVVACIEWWVENDFECSANELERRFRALVTPLV